VEAAVGPHVDHVGHPPADAVEVLEIELHPSLVGDGQEVEHHVGGAPDGVGHRDGVLEGGLGEDVTRPDAGLDQGDDRFPAGVGEVVQAGVDGGADAEPGSDMPRASATDAMVLAVNMPAQAPTVGQALRSIRDNSSAVNEPAAWAPTASNTLTMSRASPLEPRPGEMLPPYRNTLGRLTRAAAMSMPGRDLSQPAKVTRASNRSACIITSTESAMISRLTRDARIPSWPMEMPSLMAMVMNSRG